MRVGLFWIEGFKEDKLKQLLKIPDNGFGGSNPTPHTQCMHLRNEVEGKSIYFVDLITLSMLVDTHARNKCV